MVSSSAANAVSHSDFVLMARLPVLLHVSPSFISRTNVPVLDGVGAGVGIDVEALQMHGCSVEHALEASGCVLK